MIAKPPSASPAYAELYQSWRLLVQAKPHLRARDAARELGVSEARLVAARCAHGDGVALQAKPGPLLEHIVALGPVMALTRSSAAVLESIGTYGTPDIGEHSGIVIGDNIDLRVFPSGWIYAFALTESTADGTRRSIAVFDAAGAASHKVCLRPQSNIAAFDELVRSLHSTQTAEPPALVVASATAPPTAETDVDAAAYRTAYAAMQDTHDFFMLLRRFNLTREAGLRLAGAPDARPVALDAHRILFAQAAAAQIPLMIFVANDGMVQISSGPVPPATFSGPWFNLIDPRFNLHLDETGFARAWAVRKPTINGVVTSLELYAGDGTLILQVFGERHEGHTERADWAAAVAALAAPV